MRLSVQAATMRPTWSIAGSISPSHPAAPSPQLDPERRVTGGLNMMIKGGVTGVLYHAIRQRPEEAQQML